MKKTIMAVAAVLALAACGGGSTVAKPSPSSSPLSVDQTNLVGVADNLLTHVDMSGDLGGHKVTIVAAYADPVRTVVLGRVEPRDPDGPTIQLSDDQGPVGMGQGGGSANMPSGDFYDGIESGPNVGAGKVAHLSITIRFDDLPSSNPATPAPRLAFKFPIRVQNISHVALPAPFQLVGYQVRIQHLDLTPAFINLDALFAGAGSGDDLMYAPGKPELITALDGSGNRMWPVAGGGGVAEGGWDMHFQFALRGANGPYSLRFELDGAKHTIAIS